MPVLKLAFALLCAAAAIGAWLAIAFLRRTPAWPRLAAAHGAIGTASLVALAVARRRGLLPQNMGTAGFGKTAAVLLVATLALGLYFLLRRKRPPGAAVAVHAGLAISALVLLLALVALD
jgi:hypothetical protein